MRLKRSIQPTPARRRAAARPQLALRARASRFLERARRKARWSHEGCRAAWSRVQAVSAWLPAVLTSDGVAGPVAAGIDPDGRRLCSVHRTPRMPSFTPLTRAAGLARLRGFEGQGAAAYARDRNTDAGPDGDPTTSALSPTCGGTWCSSGRRWPPPWAPRGGSRRAG